MWNNGRSSRCLLARRRGRRLGNRSHQNRHIDRLMTSNVRPDKLDSLMSIAWPEICRTIPGAAHPFFPRSVEQVNVSSAEDEEGWFLTIMLLRLDCRRVSGLVRAP